MTAQEIIAELKQRGMNYASIGAAIGVSRESVSRIAHGQQSGNRMLVKLQKLAITAGVSILTQYVPPKVHKPQPKDVRPRTQEELEREEEQDRYDQWEPLAPVAKTIGQAIGGARGKIVESILPESYSLVKSYQVPEKARVVESAPRPHRPRKRKSRQQPTSTYITRSGQNHPVVFIATVILSALFPKSTTNQQQQLPAAPPQHIIPRYVPTFQYRETQEYVTLATPRMPRVNTLGYAHSEVGEPIQARPYFGKIRIPE